MQDFRARGRTVLLSSHILAEVERLCDRVSIIRSGRTVESGTLTQLRHLTRTTVRAETVRPVEGLGALPGVHDLLVEGRRVAFEVDTSAARAVVAALHRRRHRRPDGDPADAGGALPPPLR